MTGALFGVTAFEVDTGSFLAIVAAAAIAATVSGVAGGRNVFIPVVVVELVLGVVIGPQVLDLAQVSDFTDFFSSLGLGMLFFFAGYEIDMGASPGGRSSSGSPAGRCRSPSPTRSAGSSPSSASSSRWSTSGSALATTAIGTLIPVLSDTGELRTEFGRYLLAAGAVGEFGPILLLTLVLSTQSALHNALILLAFVALAVGVAVLAVRSSSRTMPVLERTIESSSQLAVRWIVVLVFALALLAAELGLDLLLGGFAAGLITRQVVSGREVRLFDSKLTAVAFGVFVPFFFVVSGMQLDVDALFSQRSGVAKLAIFFVLFLVVRGTPAMLLYRARAPVARGPPGARAVHRDAAAARRGDHDRRGRRRAHAVVDRGGAGRRRRVVDARRPAARPADAPDRRGEACGRGRHEPASARTTRSVPPAACSACASG